MFATILDKTTWEHVSHNNIIHYPVPNYAIPSTVLSKIVALLHRVLMTPTVRLQNSVNIPPKATLSQRDSHEYICMYTSPLIIL